MAAPQRDPHLRGDRAGGPAVRRAVGLHRHPPHRRRAHGAGRPADPGGQAGRPRRRPLPHHQRGQPAPAGRRPPGRRPPADQHLVRLPAAGTGSWPSPTATPSPRCSTGSTPPSRPGSPPSRSTPSSCGGSTTTRWSTSPPSAGRRASSSASSSSCPSTPTGRGRASRSCPPAEILAAIGAVYPLEPVAQRGSQPAERYVYADGGGRDRRRPQRHPQLLRVVRPGPADGRGDVPQLPVRHPGDRSAGAAALRGRPTTTWPRPSRPTSARSGPATPSARSASCGPPAA